MKPTPVVVALVLVLGACSGDPGRELASYYDPEGYFTANLPSANDVTVTPPQAAADGPALLTGVISSPPAPSPAPQAGFGGIGAMAARSTPVDQTVYQAFAMTTDRFDDLSHMALYFFTGDPSVDVVIDDPIRLDDLPAELIVADIVREGQVTASVAAVVSLGQDGTGFLLAALFPPDSWDAERSDFMRVVRSFHADVPPGLDTFPVTAEVG